MEVHAVVTPDGFVENMRRLDISRRDIDIIVLSHGHFDHASGLDGLGSAVRSPIVPMVVHPILEPTQTGCAGPRADELPSTSRRALEAEGFEVIERGAVVAPGRLAC